VLLDTLQADGQPPEARELSLTLQMPARCTLLLQAAR
jgi:hypothetical protein